MATILGLLLVVTMVANYLGTQLPAQMQVNDANHALAVENQVERLATTLQGVAATGKVGAVVSQPVSLGSVGAPPFAAPDGASIGPGVSGSQVTESYTVSGVVTVPQKSSGGGGASFVVDLRNTYTPKAVVAFDQGAVIYAQPSGLPLMLVGPAISFSGGELSVWVPQFLGTVGTEVGVGTAELSARLVSLLNLSLPLDGFSLSGKVSIAVTTPYAAAWESYFTQPTSTLASDVTCAPKLSVACSGPFNLNGPLGTVYVNVTAKALSIQTATFALTVG